MPAPQRSPGNRRLYGPEHADRLAFIRYGRDLGFAPDAIRGLLDLSDNPDQSCEAADRAAKVHLKVVEVRIERMMVLKTELKQMIRQCQGGKVTDCRVI